MTKADLEIRVWTQEQILRNARTIAISLQVDEQHQEGRAGLTSGKLSFVSELEILVKLFRCFRHSTDLKLEV